MKDNSLQQIKVKIDSQRVYEDLASFAHQGAILIAMANDPRGRPEGEGMSEDEIEEAVARLLPEEYIRALKVAVKIAEKKYGDED